jgi:putative transposase
MARSARTILDNAIYHIMARGNQKQTTFFEEEDFLTYLDFLKHYKKKFNFSLYGYCLMPNHVHLIMEIIDGQELAKIMQGMNQSYAVWFNDKYAKVGHLWQGRYKSKIITKDKYLFDCIIYVELNPVRANICPTPAEYPWTSWKTRVGHQKNVLLDNPLISGTPSSSNQGQPADWQ